MKNVIDREALIQIMIRNARAYIADATKANKLIDFAKVADSFAIGTFTTKDFGVACPLTQACLASVQHIEREDFKFGSAFDQAVLSYFHGKGRYVRLPSLIHVGDS